MGPPDAALSSPRQALPHVGGEEAQERVDGDLVPDHLVPELRVGHLGGVLVGPRVAGDLVPFLVHSLLIGSAQHSKAQNKIKHSKLPYLDDSWVFGRRVVYVALAKIVSSDEEGSLCPIALNSPSSVLEARLR